jgi:hypothetical protein
MQLDYRQSKNDLTSLTKVENGFSVLVDLDLDLDLNEAQLKHPALIDDLKRRYKHCAQMAQKILLRRSREKTKSGVHP